MGSFIQDIRYAFRQMKKNPGFTLAAIICLALGIGANTATFSFANSFLRPKPMVSDPDRLVRLFVEWSNGLKFGSFSYPDYQDFRSDNGVFEDLAAESLQAGHLSNGETNERIIASLVSGNYFSVLGVKPAIGRGFSPEEDVTPGTHPVTVLSHGLWQRRFGGTPDVIGKTLLLSGNRFTVIGVAPENFTGSNTAIETDLWVPLKMQEQAFPGLPRLRERGDHWIGFITGRLKSNVTPEQAEVALNARAQQLAEIYPETNRGLSIVVYPENEASLHPRVRGAFVNFMAMMFVVVGLVLLLACANVAGLLLARFTARRKEIGIRLAIGAGRGRLIRQLLVESTILSLSAGCVGLLLSLGLSRLLLSIPLPANLPLRFSISMDYRVLLFTLGASLLTGVIFGLAPALQTTRQNLVTSLKETTSSVGGGNSKLRQGLVVGQVALSLVLLIGAGLVIRSLQNVRNLDPGFDPDNQIVASLDADLQGYDQAQAKEFFRNLIERLESKPGIEAVGLSRSLPLSLNSRQRSAIPEGYEIPPGSQEPSIDYNFVDTGYFRAMGIPIRQGREFTINDNENSPPVIVINEMFAERFWPGESSLGKRVRTGGKDHEVIGVVKTGKYFSLGEDPKPFFYVSLNQDFRGSVVLHVRSPGSQEAIFGVIRQEVRNLDRAMPVSDLQTMHSALSFALLPARLAAGAVTVFAGLALLLATIGIYGVIAYSVRQGIKDIAIRLALGAKPFDVLKLQFGKGLTLVLTGLVIGFAGAVGAGRLMSGLLYGVSISDPILYAGPALVLLIVAGLAIYMPARRAMDVDPIVALREE